MKLSYSHSSPLSMTLTVTLVLYIFVHVTSGTRHRSRSRSRSTPTGTIESTSTPKSLPEILNVEGKPLANLPNENDYLSQSPSSVPTTTTSSRHRHRSLSTHGSSSGSSRSSSKSSPRRKYRQLRSGTPTSTFTSSEGEGDNEDYSVSSSSYSTFYYNDPSNRGPVPPLIPPSLSDRGSSSWDSTSSSLTRADRDSSRSGISTSSSYTIDPNPNGFPVPRTTEETNIQEKYQVILTFLSNKQAWDDAYHIEVALTDEDVREILWYLLFGLESKRYHGREVSKSDEKGMDKKIKTFWKLFMEVSKNKYNAKTLRKILENTHPYYAKSGRGPGLDSKTTSFTFQTATNFWASETERYKKRGQYPMFP